MKDSEQISVKETRVWRTLCPPTQSYPRRSLWLSPICAHDPGENQGQRERQREIRVSMSSLRDLILSQTETSTRWVSALQGHKIKTRAAVTFCSQGCGQGNRQLDFCLLHTSPHWPWRWWFTNSWINWCEEMDFTDTQSQGGLSVTVYVRNLHKADCTSHFFHTDLLNPGIQLNGGFG